MARSLATSATIESWTTLKSNSTNRIFIGASGSWGGAAFHYPFDGIIDEVGIFNVPLTVGEITSLMNNGLADITAMSPKGKLATTWADIK